MERIAGFAWDMLLLHPDPVTGAASFVIVNKASLVGNELSDVMVMARYPRFSEISLDLVIFLTRLMLKNVSKIVISGDLFYKISVLFHFQKY